MRIFKEIPGFPGYKASRCGAIKSDRGVEMVGYSSSGYKGVQLSRYRGDKSWSGRRLRERVNRLVHRLVYETFQGPIPKGMWINHIDGDKLNNRISNLELTTPSENHRHARDVLKRKYARGEEVGMSKFTEKGVEAVKFLFLKGWSQHDISKAFGVSQPCISYIVRGKTWK